MIMCQQTGPNPTLVIALICTGRPTRGAWWPSAACFLTTHSLSTEQTHSRPPAPRVTAQSDRTAKARPPVGQRQLLTQGPSMPPAPTSARVHLLGPQRWGEKRGEGRKGGRERWRGTERQRVQKGQANLEPSPECLFQSTKEGVPANEQYAFLTSQNVPGKVPNIRHYVLGSEIPRRPLSSCHGRGSSGRARRSECGRPHSWARHVPSDSHLVVHAPHKAQRSHPRKPPLPSVPVETQLAGDYKNHLAGLGRPSRRGRRCW